MLMIDGDEPVSHLSSPGSTELNTDGIVWIGGKDGLPIGLPAAFYQRFVGCLQNVQIDGMDLNLIHHALGLHRPSLCR
uniref:Laminin G domain-containing protein n=1 Tax=Plectus sambesii TaxID=2011161 RepID=A0A914VPB4_9BILA